MMRVWCLLAWPVVSARGLAVRCSVQRAGGVRASRVPTAIVGVLVLLAVGCRQERPAAPAATSGGTSSASTSSGAASGTGPVASLPPPVTCSTVDVAAPCRMSWIGSSRIGGAAGIPASPASSGIIAPEEPQLRPDGRFLPNRAAASSAGAVGGIAADAPTLARWGYELYGGHLLTPEAVQQMTTPCLEDYGLGTVIGKLGDLDVVGHDASIPGYLASLQVFPRHRLSVAVLVPDSDVDLSVLLQRLSDAVAAR